MANKIIIELDVDEQGRASAALKSLEGDVRRFTDNTNRAGDSGHRLRDIFTGNLLADFFQRGTGAAVAFTARAIQASALASDANRVLEFSATRAGLSYARAGEQAEDFGRRVGASNAAAAATFADIVRLAERAGRAQDIDLISKRFADLSAARGIQGEELRNLIGTILSGQDEGLNRLGIDDPGKLNAAYAAQLGKTADALTQTEKARAALNAVLEKGAEAEGQATQRLQGAAGQLNSTSASVENLTTQVGDAVTNSIEYRDVLQTIGDVLEGVITSHARARAELAKGLKTPEQIAQEERDSAGRQVFNALKGGASLLAGVPFTLYDQFQLSTGQISLDEYNTRIAGSTEAAFNPGQRQYEARVAQLRQLQDELKRQEADATRRAQQLGSQDAEAARRTTLQTSFDTRLGQALKGDDAEALRQLKQELQSLGNVFDAGDSNSLTKKIDDQLDQIQKKTVETARTARDAVRSFLADMAQAADKDNPFVSLFVRAQVEVEETRRKFLIFGADFADEMARIKKESLDAELAIARFTSQTQALKYAQEARRLSQPFIGQTGPEDRRLDVLNEQIKFFQQDPDLLRRQRFLENPFRPFTSLDSQRQLRGQLEQLLSLDVAGAGRGGREAQAAAILELAKQFDPRELATSGDPALRRLRGASIDALSVQREGLQQNVQDAIARERAGQFIQKDARELLAAITASGLRDDAKVKEFLSVIGALSVSELTPDLRRARVEALRDAARIESAREQDGERRARKLENFLDRFDKALTDKGIKLDGSTGRVEIEVYDKSRRADVDLGEGF